MCSRMTAPTAFFSLCSRVRVRDAAASGFSGEETAGVFSFSSLGSAAAVGTAVSAASSAMVDQPELVSTSVCR